MTSLSETKEVPPSESKEDLLDKEELRGYNSVKDVPYGGSWLREGNDGVHMTRSFYFTAAAISACAEHRWEDAAKILPLLFFQIESIPADILLSFTNLIIRNHDSLSLLKDSIYEKFIPWLYRRNYITVLGMISDDLPNIKHENLPAFLEKIGRLCTATENLPGKKKVEKLTRLKFLSFGYTALIMFYYYLKEYEQEGGELQCLSETKPDNDFQEDRRDKEEKARKKVMIGLNEALVNFSIALQICEEPCEWLMGPYLHAIKVVQGSKQALEELEKYVQKNPLHLPAHRLAYQFLGSCPGTEKLQQKQLKEIIRLCPNDPLVITYAEDLLKKGTYFGFVIKVINLMMDMIEFKEWRWNVKPWKTLCYALRRVLEKSYSKRELKKVLNGRTPLWKHCVWIIPTYSQISFNQAEILFYSTYVAFVLEYDKTYLDHMEKIFVEYGCQVLVKDLKIAKKCIIKRRQFTFLENFTAYKESHRSLYGKDGVFDKVKIQNSDSNNDVSLGAEKPLNCKDIHFSDADFVTSTQVLDSPHKIPSSKELETCKSPASIDLYQDSYIDFSAEIPCGQKDPVLEKEEIKERGLDYNSELFDHNSVDSQKRNANEQHSSRDSDSSDMESVIPPGQDTDLMLSPKILSNSFSKTKKDLFDITDITVNNSVSENDTDSSTFDMYSSLTGLTPSSHVSINKSQVIGNATFSVETESSFPFIDINNLLDDKVKHKNLEGITQNSVSKSGGKKTYEISPNLKLSGDSLPSDDLMSTVKVKTELRDYDEICDEPVDDQNVPPSTSKIKNLYNYDTKKIDCEIVKASGNNNESSVKHSRLTNKDRDSFSDGPDRKAENQSSLTNGNCKSDNKKKIDFPKSYSAKHRKISCYNLDNLPFPVLPSQVINDSKDENDSICTDKEKFLAEGNHPIEKEESFLGLQSSVDVDVDVITSCHKKQQRENESVESKIIHAISKEEVVCNVFYGIEASKSNSVLKRKKTDIDKTEKSRTPRSSLKKSKRKLKYKIDDLPFPVFPSQETKEDNDGILNRKYIKCSDVDTIVLQANENNKLNAVGNESKEIHSGHKEKDESVVRSGKYSSNGKNNKKTPLSSTKKHQNTSIYELEDLPFPDFHSQKTSRSSQKKKENSSLFKVDDLPFPNYESQAVLEDVDRLKFSYKTEDGHALDATKCMGQSVGKKQVAPPSSLIKNEKSFTYELDDLPMPVFKLEDTFEDSYKKEVSKKIFEKIVDNSNEHSSSSKRKKRKYRRSLKKQQVSSVYQLDDLPFPVFESQNVLEKSDETENDKKDIFDPVGDSGGQSPVVKNEKISSKKKKKILKSLESFTNKNCESTQFVTEDGCKISEKLMQSDNDKPEKNSSENQKRCLSQESLMENIESENFQRSENYVGENSELDFDIEIKQEEEDSYDDLICIPRYIKSDSGVGKIFNEVHTLDSSSIGDISSDDGYRNSEVKESPSCINQHLLGNAYPENIILKKNNKIMKDTRTHLFCSTPIESVCVSKKAPFTVLKGEEDTKKKVKNLDEEVGALIHMDLDDNDISKISCTVGTKRGIENVISPLEFHQAKRLKTKDFSSLKSNSIKSETPVFATKKSYTVGTKRHLEYESTPQEAHQAKRLKTKDFSLLKSNSMKSETPVFASRCKSKLGKKLFTPGGIGKCLDGSKNKSSLSNGSGCKASLEDSP